jgi:sulfoxide reductase catalytic subunit YedY
MKYEIPSSEITSEELYYSRRRFLKRFVAASGAALLVSSCRTELPVWELETTTPPQIPTSLLNQADEQGNPLTDYQDIISYTNFYEFSTDKSAPTRLSSEFKTDPWEVTIGGLVKNPLTLDMDDIRRKFIAEERVYRMRCVEGWSMVIPWNGFPLHQLLNLVEPTSEAKYVRFVTIFDPDQMQGQRSRSFPWPYIEGLRLDEALHDLTLLASGIYGQPLTPQNGAPIRLVVPWKYGFKSIKSIVKIELVEEMPNSLWMATSPREYGFFANVNPDVPHPRWSQSSETRIGQSGRIDTQLFNGYQKEVGQLYAGLDLTSNF